MIDLSKYLDPYDLKARVQPALICILPLVIAVYLYLPIAYEAAAAIAAVVVAFGGTELLSQLARDRGKRLEPWLFDRWEGIPSVAILRRSSRTLPGPALEQIHESLGKVSGIEAPSPELELRSPEEADEVYRAWSDHLRSATRDTNRYALIFKENVNYGFRRNFLGLKPVTLGITAVSLIGGILANLDGQSISLDALGWSFIAVCLMYAVVVGLCVRPDWVKVPADEYAKRLIESVSEVSN